MDNDHPQTHIALNGREADVDVGMAELILACWRHDIETALSCQKGVGGRAWIEFPLAEDARRFLELAVPNDDSGQLGGLWQRAFQGTAYPRVGWQWRCHPVDLSDDRESTYALTPIQAWFPPRDIPELVRNHNKA
jgi:hypothetical protein